MLISLLTCADPALERYSVALAAWEDGRAEGAAGRPLEAARAFAAARAKDPENVALRLWEAKALADAGALSDADAGLGELLQAGPNIGIAWYNRAAYRARAGRFNESAADLTRALALGALSPLEAAADPDFFVARTHPAFVGILPLQPLEASVRGPEGAVFLGSRVPVELTLVTLPSARLTLVRAGDDPGCLGVSRVLQDDLEGEGSVERRVTLELRARGPCVAHIGPFTITSDEALVELPAVAIRIEAPTGTGSPSDATPLPVRWPVPSMYSASDTGFACARVDDGVVALGRPDRSITGNGRRPDVVLEWRVGGQTRTIGGWWWESGPVALAAEGWAETVP